MNFLMLMNTCSACRKNSFGRLLVCDSLRKGLLFRGISLPQPGRNRSAGRSSGRRSLPRRGGGVYRRLGMGKTAFTRGLARGLGCTGRVTSPTFTIVNEYEGRLPLFHFDMYRLLDEDALFDIGWEDYLDRGGICAVEWSEQVSGALPPDAVRVDIARHPGCEDWRRITIEGVDLP